MVFYKKTNKSKMSSIPQGAFAAFKVNQYMAKSKGRQDSSEAKHFNPFLTNENSFEHPLLKYSSKLMNSIWGLYNRYSVHNFKKNAASGTFNVFENHRL